MSLLNFFGVSSKLSAMDPIHNFWYGSVGTKTAAGVDVDEHIAMTYSACWAATRLLAGTGGWLPFNLYRKRPGGGSDIMREHRVHRICHDQPNAEMGSMAFRTSRINHQVNWGNCFSEIGRNAAGLAIELHPIHPSRIPKQNIVRQGGELVYRVKNNDGTVTPIPARDMFHVPSIITDDGILGRGVVENARLSIGFGIATERQGAAYFGNSARPKIVLEGGKFKEKSDREDFRRQWEEVHGGPENANRPAFLPEGMKLTALDFSAEDSQFLETRQHNTEEIARWYGVPPHMIGHLLRSTFNNIEHQGIEFVKYSLLPWLKLWEQEVWRKLLTPEEQNEGYYAKFVVDALERGDLASRTEAGVKKFFNGLWTLDQWAEQEDMNPIGETVVIDGKPVNLGSIHFVQQAMIPLADAAKGPQEPVTPTPPPDEQDESSESNDASESVGGLSASGPAAPDPTELIAQLQAQHEASQRTIKQLATAMLRDVSSRMLSVEVNAVKRVAEKPSRFTDRLSEFYEKHAAALSRALVEPLAACLAAAGDTRDAATVAAELTSRHVEVSKKQLDALLDCQPDELSSRVEQCVSRWHEERAGINLEN